MAKRRKLLRERGEGRRNPLALALLSLLAGTLAGLVGALFRLALSRLNLWRTAWIHWAHHLGWPGILLVVAATTFAAAIAAWMVRRFSPESSGSGIPYVEMQLRERWIGNHIPIVIVKFFGGLLAIGSGLALGREGPTIQIGAGIGHLVGGLFRRNENERRVLLAACAGAGLSTAFNAPIAGAVFVLEELVGGFNVPISIATLGASAGAIGLARHLLGQQPDFVVPILKQLEVGKIFGHLALGIVLGFLGVLYSRAILGAIGIQARFARIPVEFRAGAIGAMIGVFGWFFPAWIGGGDNLTQQALSGNVVYSTIAVLFVVRFLLPPISYSAETPGGLFAPMLTVGSQAGLLFGFVWAHIFGGGQYLPTEFAIVGIAALFTAVVRAPVTGIILAIELTGAFGLFLPMLAAAFTAMTVATLMKQEPIYDSLRVAPNSDRGEIATPGER
jgi:chloride channel protein, CIC family